MQIKDKIDRTLSEVSNILKLFNNDFFVIGAAAMILSGVDVGDTEDVDILTSEQNARILKNYLAKDTIDDYTPQRSDLFRSFFNRYKTQLMDIEVMGNLEVNINGKWTLLTIEDYTVYTIGDLDIKLPTLQEQRRILTLFGREKDMRRIELIDRYLDKY